jgi:hypothetical protein
VSTVGVESPQPEGVIVIVPLKGPPTGVTVKLPDVVLATPAGGQVSVKDVAAIEEYVTAGGLVRLPELVGVSVTVPPAWGVIVKVCADAELVKVKTIGVERPPPLGVRVMVPV